LVEFIVIFVGGEDNPPGRLMPRNSFVWDTQYYVPLFLSFVHEPFSFVLLTFYYFLMADGFALGLKICYFFQPKIYEVLKMECDVNEITQGLGFYRNHGPEG
jgi:hypothetical protein